MPDGILSAKARRRYRQLLIATQGPICAYCRKVHPAWRLSLDHRVPVSRGGTDNPDNLVLACVACNRCKADRTPTQWARDVLNAAEGVSA